MRRAPILLAALLWAAAAVAADDFGRLFFTPAERERLTQRVPADAPAAAPAPQQGPIRLDGIVRPSHAPATVWINGAPSRIDPSAAAADRASVPTPGGGTIMLRVGEGYLPGSGAKENALPRVEVHARPRP